ncbi:3-oxoacyl-[acyl-carrier-protein] synthase III C-terminal domain-containing protein [Marinobacter sp. SS13-12]|uniref:3-oxoacyl-[acyl-carrier-protein] synthase III C-terminal domain-containing protein n=1 Tax=Marinobacter sp. SS13-12 TaxID=3050451 RepID=UPI0025552F26|nr:3-oxoacyl-[acyl-carrier-protein] synthase III C-terminal domain-containing protein [Marinobacter sp. SS13-12]MDK8463494.1 3-oxoacyl-[acyl-carrier-protein] synthase III C-terminal domain-containing protein [Marinobacter sp. SS13-12]
MKPFRLNKHGKLVFPSSIFTELDFSIITDLDQLKAIIRRDFEVKAPTGTEIAERAAAGSYATRYDLLRDIGLHLFWANRYALVMYHKQPMRWRDVPRNRDDVFVPLLQPWEGRAAKTATVREAYTKLPEKWNATAEDELFALLFDCFSNKLYHATSLPPIKATIAEALATSGAMTTTLGNYDPDHQRYSVDDILDVSDEQAELEALRRWSMVLHNQQPWDRSQARLKPLAEMQDDDIVVLYYPKNRHVLEFINREKKGATVAKQAPTPDPAVEPVRPYPPVVIDDDAPVQPKIEALAIRKGEVICSNEDVVRNSPSSWSPMTAKEIADKTGIERRRYTAEPLENIALEAARAALKHAGRGAEEIGAVLFCSCTSSRLIPSTATWLSGQLGILQTHCSADIVAACAGFPYGVAEAVRLLREIERPVLLVMAEKFSDKIGNARPSRMIFGDGAAAVVIAPSDGERDIHVVQTYASGPASQVNSIIWPNHDFDNDITVYGPEVKALVKRYLNQMMGELTDLGLEIDIIVPHQANKTMIIEIAEQQGIDAKDIYFNISEVGNASAASIPIALADAVFDGAINKRSLVFAPGFGAGAVGGYVILSLDPAMVAPEVTKALPMSPSSTKAHSSIEDIKEAFHT